MTVHGGDVWQVGEELGIAAPEILDFSANINPRGLPPRARERLERDASDARLLMFYPDPSARLLRGALSKQLAVSADAIVIGPGAESLLAPILRYLQPMRALVPVPAFGDTGGYASRSRSSSRRFRSNVQSYSGCPWNGFARVSKRNRLAWCC